MPENLSRMVALSSCRRTRARVKFEMMKVGERATSFKIADYPSSTYLHSTCWTTSLRGRERCADRKVGTLHDSFLAQDTFPTRHFKVHKLVPCPGAISSCYGLASCHIKLVTSLHRVEERERGGTASRTA